MNRLNKEIGKIQRNIRNLENPRVKGKGTFNKYMKPAYKLALEYGYDTPRFGLRGFTKRDKEEVLIFLSYVSQELRWELENKRSIMKEQQKTIKRTKKKVLTELKRRLERAPKLRKTKDTNMIIEYEYDNKKFSILTDLTESQLILFTNLIPQLPIKREQKMLITVHFTSENVITPQSASIWKAIRSDELEEWLRYYKFWAENKHYPIQLRGVNIKIFKHPKGGCGLNVKTLKVGDLKIKSLKSSNNNCFFTCVKDEMNLLKISKRVCNEIRNKYGLENNCMIDIEDAKKIFNDYKIKGVNILTNNNFCLVGDKDAKKSIILMDNHYKILEGEKQYCDRCNMFYWKRHSKMSCSKRLRYQRTALMKDKRRYLITTELKADQNDSENVLHFDIETYISDQNEQTPFCLGFTYFNGKTKKWIYQYFTGSDCMITFLRFLKKCPKNIKYINAYNGANFDHYKLISEYVQLTDITDINLLLNNGSVLKAELSLNKRTFKLIDVCKHSQGTLRQNLISLKCETLKGDIDYKTFDKWENLTLSKQQEILKYLESDVKGLKEYYNILNEGINDDYDLNLSQFLSTSHMSFTIWKNSYLNELIELSGYQDTKFIRKSIYGGRTYPNKKSFVSSQYDQVKNGEISYNDLTDYLEDRDVTSLYPAAMMKEYPVGRSYKTKSFMRDYLGIYDVEVKCPKNLITPQLPRRTADNRLMWDLLDRRQVLTSIDIIRAENYGYKFIFHSGMYWKKTGYVFKDFIEDMFRKKKNSTKGTPQYLLSKLFMNSLYGKMIQKPINVKTKEVTTPEEVYEILQGYDVIDAIQFGRFLHLKYQSTDDEELNKNCTKPTHLGSFILAHSRNIMSDYIKQMNPDDSLKNSFYYTDTDSLQTHVSNSKRVPMKNGLGDLNNDLEGCGKIIKGQWIAPKLYRLEYITNKGVIKDHVRGKGVSNNLLEDNPQWYERMLKGEPIKSIPVENCFKKIHFNRNSKQQHLNQFSIYKQRSSKSMNLKPWDGRNFNDKHESVPWGYEKF